MKHIYKARLKTEATAKKKSTWEVIHSVSVGLKPGAPSRTAERVVFTGEILECYAFIQLAENGNLDISFLTKS